MLCTTYSGVPAYTPEMMGADGQDLQCVSQAAALLLRDGCDVLDVLGRQLRRGSDSAGGGGLQG